VFLQTTKRYWYGGDGPNQDEYFYAETEFKFDNRNSFYIGYHYNCYPRLHKKFCFHVNYANGEHNGDWIDFPLETIMDTWFHEKIEFNKTTGKLRYYINNNFIGEQDVADVISSATSFHLRFSPFGWWYTHKHYFDNFSVSGN
jgi:hypothetical protein